VLRVHSECIHSGGDTAKRHKNRILKRSHGGIIDPESLKLSRNLFHIIGILSPRASKSAARTSATLKNGFFIGGIFGGLGGVMRG